MRYTLPSPIRGLDTTTSISEMQEGYAITLDNFFCDNSCLTFRKGYTEFAKLNTKGTIKTIISIPGFSDLLAITDKGEIFNVTKNKLLSFGHSGNGYWNYAYYKNRVYLVNSIDDVLKLIDGKAKKIKTVAELKKIAMIASNFDSEIAEAVSQNINLFGANGSYIIEEGRVPGITAIHKSGFTFDSGYLSNSFVNDKSGAAILKNPALLIARDDYGISDIIETVNACIKNKQSLLIIGNPDDQTLMSIIDNHLKGVLQFCAVPPPYFGVKRDNFIADINKINSFPGAIKQVIVRKHSITIEHDTDLTDYIKQILNTDTLSTEEAEHNKMRAARLSGSVVIFKIGANNVGELKERKDRLEDTILSTLSSLKSGYVKGGGYTLYELSSSVSNRHLMKALQKPYLTILKNSEIKPDGKFINVLTGLNNTDDIIDSAAVIKAELKNAISVAKIFMNIADVTV